MGNVTLERMVFTNVSYNLDVETDKEFKLEVKNKISLKIPKDVDDNNFLLIFEVSIFEPERKYVDIVVKANTFFNSSEKITSFDDVVKEQCFPIAFKIITEKIDQILEILNYPKINISMDFSEFE